MSVYWRPSNQLPPIAINRAYGPWVEDRNGCSYFEASSGLLNLNIGHAHPTVLEAIHYQASKFTFAHPGTFDSGIQEIAANKLIEFLGLEDFSVLFIGSGTDAVECANLLAKQYFVEAGSPRKTKVIARSMSYHGASEATLGLSGHRRRRRLYSGFLGSPPSVIAPYCFRCPLTLKPESCDSECVQPFETEIERQGSETVAAIMVEPTDWRRCKRRDYPD